MKPCPECNGPKEFRAHETDPTHLTLWETHKHGCSWSPLITPATHSWPMRDFGRTDESAAPRRGGWVGPATTPTCTPPPGGTFTPEDRVEVAGPFVVSDKTASGFVMIYRWCDPAELSFVSRTPPGMVVHVVEKGEGRNGS